ncbi:MAG: hypothetical protein IPK28_19745 [Devosia sp.]|nr:hypothetical protein [Devosia sp.]
MKIPLTRKQARPRNVAARALRQGQFQPRVEPDPKGYRRRAKHKADPLEALDEPRSDEP